MNILKLILAPLVLLLKRLRYPWKFGLLGGLAILAIAYFMVGLAGWLGAGLSAARHEARGVALIEPSFAAMRAMQEYVGLGYVAAGNDELKPLAENALSAADKAFARLDARILDADGTLGELKPHAKRIAEAWGTVKQTAAGGEVRQIVETRPHKAVLDAIDAMLRDVADASGMSRDPDARATYLIDVVLNKLPEGAEAINGVRISGSLVLGVPGFAREWRRMGTQIEEIERTQAELEQAFKRVGRYDSGLGDALGKSAAAMGKVAGDFIELNRKNIMSGTRGIEIKPYAIEGRKALAGYYELMEDEVLDELASIINWRVRTLWLRVLLAGVLALGMAGLLAYTLGSMFLSITQSVAALGEGAQRIAAGNLGHRIRLDSRDELAGVAERFNAMASSFDTIIGTVQASVREATHAAAALRQSADAVAQGSTQQNEAAANMAATVQQVTVGIGEIARLAGEADKMASNSGQVSGRGEEIVTRTVTEIERISEAVSQSSQVIDELSNNSEAIGAIVATIKEIAEQTHLLALNAAIEAARAGESGRGFAVVADEVGKLADRTNKATQEITEMIQSIQFGTGEAIVAMQKGVGRVSDGVAMTRRAGEAMHQIHEASRQVVQFVGEISDAMREQAATSTEISRNVEQVAQMAEANHAVVGETAATTRALEQLAARLDSEMQRFTRG